MTKIKKLKKNQKSIFKRAKLNNDDDNSGAADQHNSEE